MKLIKIADPDNKKLTGLSPTNPYPIDVVGTNIKISINHGDSVLQNAHTNDVEVQSRSVKSYALAVFEKQITKKENIWAIYEFGQKAWELLKNNQNYKMNYENYVCGYLQYYDTEARSGMSDYGIYFYWGDWDNHKNSVVIFIDPPPVRELAHYQNTKVFLQKEATVNNKVTGNNLIAGYNFTDPFEEPYYGGTKEVNPPVSQVSDPPKPPPPPPPY